MVTMVGTGKQVHRQPISASIGQNELGKISKTKLQTLMFNVPTLMSKVPTLMTNIPTPISNVQNLNSNVLTAKVVMNFL